MPRNSNRAGFALMDVLISAVLLATAGVALVALLGQTARSLRDAQLTERLLDSASARLDRLLLLDRAALVAREGISNDEGWSLRIARIAPGLFDASIARSDTSSALLSTTVYRPDSADASP